MSNGWLLCRLIYTFTVIAKMHHNPQKFFHRIYLSVATSAYLGRIGKIENISSKFFQFSNYIKKVFYSLIILIFSLTVLADNLLVMHNLYCFSITLHPLPSPKSFYHSETNNILTFRRNLFFCTSSCRPSSLKNSIINNFS